MILAGGKGTRLRPVTADLPKPLVPVANRPLIVHQLRHLAASGVRDVTLALGYAADRFAEVESEADALGLNLRLLVEPQPLGTGGALRWCADQGAFDDRPLFWMNGDVVASPSIDALHAFHDERSAMLTFWLTSVRDVTQFGVMELDPDGRVQHFLEKPAPEETTSHLVNAGILMLDPALLQRIPSGRFFSFEQGLLPQLVREQEALYGLFDGGYWLDTGRPRFYLGANRHVLEGRVDWEPAGKLADDGLWEGEDVERGDVRVTLPAALGSGVVLEEGAQMFGRTVIGDGCRIAGGTELEGCVLFRDVEVGEGAVVVNSIVCAGARIGPGAVVHDSIIGADCRIGARNELRGTRLWKGVTLDDAVLIVDE